MWRVVRHPEAFQELEAAALWYEERQPNLGRDFLAEYRRALERIIEEPQRGRRIRGENRKLNLHRFPYAIVYEIKIEDHTLYLKAVMHLRRRPFYWLDR